MKTRELNECVLMSNINNSTKYFRFDVPCITDDIESASTLDKLHKSTITRLIGNNWVVLNKVTGEVSPGIIIAILQA